MGGKKKRLILLVLRNVGIWESSQGVQKKKKKKRRVGVGGGALKNIPIILTAAIWPKYDLYEGKRETSIISAVQHQVCSRLCVCADMPSWMVDDSSYVMTAGLSLAVFPAVWANMFSRHRCGHCLMESSQHGWYHHQVTLPSLDDTRLSPSPELWQVSWRALQDVTY